MHDETRERVDEAIDTLEDLGWRVSGVTADEEVFEQRMASGEVRTKNARVELDISAVWQAGTERGRRDA